MAVYHTANIATGQRARRVRPKVICVGTEGPGAFGRAVVARLLLLLLVHKLDVGPLASRVPRRALASLMPRVLLLLLWLMLFLSAAGLREFL